VRRHRLAERLLVDVLDVGSREMDAAACQFEHVLRAGLDEHICTLLGHPKYCPHGRLIPPGVCCRARRDTSIKVVAPLRDLEPGQSGRIAYIHTRERGKLDKLIAMGALPGAPVVLMQKSPSYVFRMGQAQVAVDEEIAASIYVRPEPTPSLPPRRLRLRWGRR